MILDNHGDIVVRFDPMGFDGKKLLYAIKA
jgi:hypothetical protein